MEWDGQQVTRASRHHHSRIMAEHGEAHKDRTMRGDREQYPAGHPLE